MTKNDAIKKLIEAREALANQIAERVNNADDFVEDFCAGGYRGFSADELLEMGDRLVKLNYMIAAMPRESVEDSIPVDTIPVSSISVDAFYNASLGEAWVPANWDAFLEEVTSQRMDDAARTLGVLLTLDVILAKRCVIHFARILSEDYIGTMDKVKKLQVSARESMSPSKITVDLLKELFNLPDNLATHAGRRLKGAA